MEDRRPPVVAADVRAPVFASTGSSALAVADDPRTAAPVTMEFSEHREGGVVTAQARRTGRSFAVQMLLPVFLFGLSLLFGAICLRVAVTEKLAVGLTMAVFSFFPSVLGLWITLRTAFDGVRYTFSSDRFTVHRDPMTLFDRGEVSVSLKDVFGFGVQLQGRFLRIVVLTRDGEAKFVRCNVRDHRHAAFIVNKLNRELAAAREAGHYRG